MVLLQSAPGLLGNSAPAFNIPGTDEKNHTLDSFKDAKVLVIVFMCNHCPYVLAVLDRLNQLSDEFKGFGVQFVGINANDADQYPDDSFENMKKLPIAFPYLHDETQETAKAYQAVCTPDILVYDENRKLAYHGRVDDNWENENEVIARELAEALKKILKGEDVTKIEQHPSMGCSIKWK